MKDACSKTLKAVGGKYNFWKFVQLPGCKPVCEGPAQRAHKGIMCVVEIGSRTPGNMRVCMCVCMLAACVHSNVCVYVCMNVCVCVCVCAYVCAFMEAW